MHQYYAIDKKTERLAFISGSLLLLFNAIKAAKREQNEFYITEDSGVKYISTIVYVDGKCIYNNIDFWVNGAPEVLKDYDAHTVIDVLGNPVGRSRFETEYYSNTSRVAAMDGAYGESDYNISVSQEFISLFHRECTLTNFQTITPMEIFAKLQAVTAAVQTGSFREAANLLKGIENDPFLTPERVKKYVDMLTAADAITYADDGATIFTASVGS